MAEGTYTRSGFYAQRIGGAPRSKATVYKSFGKGLDVFSNHNEIKDDEFYEGVNGMIVGKGSYQLPRFGTKLITRKVGSTLYNGGGIFRDKTTNPPTETLLLMFDGRLYKYAGGTLVEIDNTKTWNTQAKIQGVMFQDWFYFGNGVDPLSKTNISTVVQFIEIQKPVSITVTYTGTGSDYLYRYALTVVTDFGESDPIESTEYWGNKTLDGTNYFTITCPRKTESQVIGYNLYRSINGSRLQYVTHIPQPASGDPSISDRGLSVSLIYEAPMYNTTGGVKGKFFSTFKNTLFVAGVNDYPDIIFYTGTGESYESFSPDTNGGWVRVDYGDGQRIVSMKNFDTFLLIIKENKVFRFDFSGSEGAPTLTIAESLYGSSYPYTIDKFEKDIIMLSNDNRIRTLGYEPNLLNVLRTNDISNRVQSIIDTQFNLSNPENIIGIYWKQKYILCDGSVAIAYDRQYVGFHGIWTNFNYAGFMQWNTQGKQILLGIQNNGNVLSLLVDGVYTDNGAVIPASFRPKTIDGDEDTIPKFFRFYKVKIKDFQGSFKLQTYIDGLTLEDERTISIGGSSGIASSMFGKSMFGSPSEDTDDTTTSALGTTKIITKEIYKEGYYHHVRFEVRGDDNNYLTVQSIMSLYDYEDIDYHKQEEMVYIDF